MCFKMVTAQGGCRRGPAQVFHDGLWHPGGPAEDRQTYFTMVCGTKVGRQRAGTKVVADKGRLTCFTMIVARSGGR